MRFNFKNLKNMPAPGLRNIKTSLAVFVCLLFYAYIERDGAIFAVMAVLICMQDSVEKSIGEGISRTVGTILGASFAILFLYIDIVSQLTMFWYYFFCVLGLVVLIHICNLVNIRKSIVIAGIVYLVIILGADQAPILYSVHRTIDTLLGIVLAVVINRFMFRPRPEGKKELNLIVTHDRHTVANYSLKEYEQEESEYAIRYTINLTDEEAEKIKNLGEK